MISEGRRAPDLGMPSQAGNNLLYALAMKAKSERELLSINGQEHWPRPTSVSWLLEKRRGQNQDLNQYDLKEVLCKHAQTRLRPLTFIKF